MLDVPCARDNLGARIFLNVNGKLELARTRRSCLCLMSQRIRPRMLSSCVRDQLPLISITRLGLHNCLGAMGRFPLGTKRISSPHSLSIFPSGWVISFFLFASKMLMGGLLGQVPSRVFCASPTARRATPALCLCAVELESDLWSGYPKQLGGGSWTQIQERAL